jgi:hypothetical protein
MKKRKVRIIAMPKAGSGLEVKINSGMGFNARQLNWPRLYNEFSAPDIEVKKTISGDPNPNIEAEGGETIVDDRDKDGIAEHYTISGPRHTHGGVDINAGENAFVFSDTKAMKIGGDVLKAFNKSTKKKLTPADIAKQYDINEYLKDLKDPDTDDIQRKTAEMMIANYNKKLGALALVQESKKGFDAGVPVIAHDYLQSIGMDPAMFSQNLGQSEEPDADMPAMARYGGNFPKAQYGKEVGQYVRRPDNNDMDYINDPDPKISVPAMRNVYGLHETSQPHFNPLSNNDGTDQWGKNMAVNLNNLHYNQAWQEEQDAKAAKTPKTLPGKFEDLEAKLADAYRKEQLQKKITEWNTPIEPSFWDMLKIGSASIPYLFHQMTTDLDHEKKMVNQLGEQKLRDMTNHDFNFDNMTFGAGAPIYDETSFAERKARYEKLIKEDKKIKDAFAKVVKKGTKSVLPKRHYSSQEEYQADLLSPYSPEKVAAQREWLIAQMHQKKAADVASSPMPGVEAEQVNPGALTDVIINPADTAGLSAQPWQKFGGEQELKKYWLGGPNGEGRKKVQASGPQKGYTIYEDGSEQDPSGKWTKNATVPKPGSNTAQAGQGSGKVSRKGETYNVYNEEAMKEADRLGYHYIHPSEAYRWNQENVGTQSPATNPDMWNYDAEAGFIVPKNDKTYGTGALNDFTSRWGDIIDKYPGGKEAWVKDLKEGYKPGQRGYNNQNKAMKYLLPLANEEHKKITGHELQSLTQEGAFIPGSKLFSLPRLAKKEPQQPRDPGARVETRTPPPEADYKPTVNKFVPGEKRDVPDEYWLQDAIRQHGNARDYLTLDKYMPWQATPNVHLADAVFEDPNRGIAAMQEGVNAQNQLMGTFAGPQGLARSQASARGANSMADYIAGVANRNIDRANQLDVYNTGVLNQGAMNRAGLATQLFDKNTIANQQFDNSRRQILRNMDDTAINAETNRAYTHNLNQVNPHFNIRPGTGGDMAFTGYNDPLSPSYDDPQEWLKGYTSYKKVMPNLTVEEYQSIRNGSKGSKSKNPYADMADAGMYPGGQQTSDPWT